MVVRLRHGHKRKLGYVLGFGFVFVAIEIIYTCGFLSDFSNKLDQTNALPVIHLEDYEDASEQRLSRAYPKQVLFWTELLVGENLKGFCFKKDHLENCPYKCDFTTDRSYFEMSDAVVFDCRHLRLRWRTVWRWLLDRPAEFADMPSYRMEHQYWVFTMFESPIHTWVDLKSFENVFNWTMTFRRNSDIYIPYGKLIPVKENQSTENFQELFSEKALQSKKLVAWVVSNCIYQPSKRDEVVKELNEYIDIDIYGKCGTLPCTKYEGICEDPLKCYQHIGPKYKFYLAFENSLCEDYITEKFFHSLRVGMVPVVYGYGNYSLVAPTGSFIDARAFPSIKALAEYLTYLDTNTEEYLKFFEWRKSYMVENTSYFESAWCSLCKKLWEAGNESRTMVNLDAWWFHKSTSSKEPVCLSV